jgi:hypothetical protein
MRVLITGSRDLLPEHRPVVEEALIAAVKGDPGPHTLVQGGARGADLLAAKAARKWGWQVETYFPDWSQPCTSSCRRGHRRKHKSGSGTYCPAAGDYRNQRMVDSGVDVCVAIYHSGSKNKGTSDCAKRAGAAQIPIIRRTAGAVGMLPVKMS